jgi:hypothetical protein
MATLITPETLVEFEVDPLKQTTFIGWAKGSKWYAGLASLVGKLISASNRGEVGWGWAGTRLFVHGVGVRSCGALDATAGVLDATAAFSDSPT